MSHHDRRHRFTLALALFALLAGLLAAGPAAAQSDQDPRFTDVSDILGGRRSLLRIEDVVVIRFDAEHTDNVAQAFWNPTRDSHLTNDATDGLGEFILGNRTPEFTSAGSVADNVAPHALGRMYNLPRDVFVSVLLILNQGWNVVVTDVKNPHVHVITPVPTSLGDLPDGKSEQAVVLADFDGKGYAGALIAYLGQNAQGQVQTAMRIVTPVDVNDITKGVSFGPEVIAPLGLPLSTLKTGDVNGDGRADVISFNPATKILSVYGVDPKTHRIDLAATAGIADQVSEFNVIAGRFRNRPFDDIALVGQTAGWKHGLSVYSFTGGPLYDIQFVTSRQVLTITHPLLNTYVAKGPMADPFSRQNYLVVGGGFDIAPVVAILSAGDKLHFALLSESFVGRSGTCFNHPGYSCGCLYGMEVGNFDNLQGDAQHRVHNASLQIATLWREQPFALSFGKTCSDRKGQTPPSVRLWSVTPGSNQHYWGGWLNLTQDFEVLGRSANPTSMALRVGDVQGRSMVLGAPEKVTIVGNFQPDIVLGTPPMHIDWISPHQVLDRTQYPGCQNPLSPCQLNLTVKPDVPPSLGSGFTTQYAFTADSSQTSDRKSTTSWSLGVKNTTEAKVSYGKPNILGVSVDVKQSVGYTHDGLVAKAHGTYQGQKDTLNITTGFDDYVLYTERRQTIYYYPVIGRTVCPAEDVDCVKSKPGPLYVSYSGPDLVYYLAGDASTLDWYQPVHEPGNLFSYPTNYDQLLHAFSTFGLLPLTAQNPTLFGTGGAHTTLSTTWTNTGTTSSESNSTNSQSYSLSVSVSGSAGTVVNGVTVSNTFELNESTSVATHNAETQSVSDSTGVTVSKPDFAAPVQDFYHYVFGSIVFGEQSPRPGGPNGIPQNLPVPPGIKTTGPMTVAYIADPLQTPGGFWQEAYTRPDVGLNHPERWTWNKATLNTPGFASFNAPEPPSVSPRDQFFYHMKGFFITPHGSNGRGPNRSHATAGDQLDLAVRVYNFSATDMDPDTKVWVRIYGQKFDTKTNALVHPAFLIGETTLVNPLPGLKSGGSAATPPNWIVTTPENVTTPIVFDTTPYPDTSLVFWVVVWMEDATGRLVAELPDHGLRENPHHLSFTDILEVPVEHHSNNVGLYGAYSLFYVAPRQTPDAVPPARGHLAIVDVTVPDTPVMTGQKALIAVELRAAGGSLDGVPVIFYDGDPSQGAKVFSFQHVAHINPDEPHIVRALLRPEWCGTHTILVRAGNHEDGTAETTATIEVVGGATGCTRQLTALGSATAWIGLRNSDDVGTNFDLKAEVYLGEKLVGSGQVNGVPGGGSGFNYTKPASVPLSLLAPVDAPPGVSLSVKLSARITCSGKTHGSGSARLWLNDAQAASRAGVFLDGVEKSYYLKTGSALNANNPGSGPKSALDVAVTSKAACGGRPFTPFGTWSITLP